MAKKKRAAAAKTKKAAGVKFAASALIPLWDAISELAGNRMSLLLAVRVRRMKSKIGEFHAALFDNLTPLIEKHTGGKKVISPADPGHAAFHEEAQPYLNEEVEIDVEPLAIEALPGDMELSAKTLDVLLELGLLTE